VSVGGSVKKSVASTALYDNYDFLFFDWSKIIEREKGRERKIR